MVPLGLAHRNEGSTVVLIDTGMRIYIDQDDDDPRPETAVEWMTEHNYILVDVMNDPTYGRMEIYKQDVLAE